MSTGWDPGDSRPHCSPVFLGGPVPPFLPLGQEISRARLHHVNPSLPPTPDSHQILPAPPIHVGSRISHPWLVSGGAASGPSDAIKVPG